MGFEALFGSGWKFPLTREDVFSENAIEPNKKRREKEPISGDSLSPALSSRQRRSVRRMTVTSAERRRRDSCD